MNRALLESTAVSTAKRKFHPYAIYRRSEVWGIPAIPDHWQEKPLKCVVAINTDKLPETTDPDYEIEYVDIGNVNLEAGITSTERYRFENAPSRARRRVRHGDTIVSTVRTYLKAVAQIVNPPDNLIVSTGFAVLRAKPPLDPGFLYRLAQSEPLVERIMAHSVGVSYPAINASEIGRFTIPLPPLDEQRAIAAFLDRETAKIDELIAKKQRLIELLKEKRQAVISRAVTKGLNPDAPMKPSGIDWLGDVPAHWEIAPLYARFSLELGKMLDAKQITGEHLVPYLRNVDVQWDHVNITSLPEMDIEPHEYRRFILQKGDLLVCEGGEVGRSAIWNGELQLCAYQKALHRLRPRSGDDCARFLFYVFRHAAAMGVFVANGNPNTIPHLTGEKLRVYRFPFPPLQEQGLIVAHLDKHTKQLDTLASSIQQGIDRLQQYRSALITAAVTGQIDVRQYGKEAT